MEKSSKQNIQKIQEGAELVFKLWFYLYVILSTCNLTYGTHIVSWCMWPMLVLGAVLVLARFIRIKDYIRMPLLWILILMFASYLFTMATNLQYESHKGLVTMVFWLFYFGLLYPVRTGDDTGRVKKEFTLMAVVHIGYALLMTLTSLGMMAVGYSSSYIDTNNGNYEVVSGFCYGRLWGTFQDPNLGAIVCCTAIALSYLLPYADLPKMVESASESFHSSVCCLYWFFGFKKRASESGNRNDCFCIFSAVL